MPEKEITGQKAVEIRNYINEQGGTIVASAITSLKGIAEQLSGPDSAVFRLNNEPIVLYQKAGRPMVFVGQKLAEQLEAAGIVNFSSNRPDPVTGTF